MLDLDGHERLMMMPTASFHCPKLGIVTLQTNAWLSNEYPTCWAYGSSYGPSGATPLRVIKSLSENPKRK